MSLRLEKKRRRTTMHIALQSDVPCVVAERERFFARIGEEPPRPIKPVIRRAARRLVARPREDYARLFCVTVLAHSEEIAKAVPK